MTSNQIQFINHFVDSVTVRPFFEDLRRSKQLSRMLSRIPQFASTPVAEPVETRKAA